MEVPNAVLNLRNKLLHADHIIFVLPDVPIPHLQVDLVEQLEVTQHLAFPGGVVVVPLHLQLVLLVVQLLVSLPVHCLLFVGLLPGLLVVCLAVET